MSLYWLKYFFRVNCVFKLDYYLRKAIVIGQSIFWALTSVTFLLLRGFYKTLILLDIGRKFPHSTARQRQVIVEWGRRLWKSSEGSNLLAPSWEAFFSFSFFKVLKIETHTLQLPRRATTSVNYNFFNKP